MDNQFTFVAAISFLSLAILGCSSINPLASKQTASPTPTPHSTRPSDNNSTPERSTETASGDETIGVPECDEVMDMLTAEANNPEDGYIVKAGKALVFNKIKQSIRESIDKNKGDTAELVKTCRDAKIQLEKAKAEQESKKGK